MTEYTHYSDVSVDGSVSSSSQGLMVGSLKELPFASKENLNHIILYTGETTAELDKDRFYQCIQNVLTGNYEWKLMDIGGGSGGTTVVPSAERVAGAPITNSMTVDGDVWNFPMGAENIETTLTATATAGEYTSTISAGDFQKLKNGGCGLKAQLTMSGFGGGVYTLTANDITHHTSSEGGTLKEFLLGMMVIGNKKVGSFDIDKTDGKLILRLIALVEDKDIEEVKDFTTEEFTHDASYSFVKDGAIPIITDASKRAISDELPNPDGSPGTPFADKYASKTAVDSHIGNTNNPHSVNKDQVGLGNVDNTSDMDKPVSTATQTALNTKQDVNNMTNTLDGELSDLYPSATLLKTELAKKEDLSNKKTTFTDATSTDVYYPTVKATRDFVNSSVQTATANFLGSWDDWASVPETEEAFRLPPKKNDYIVVLLDESHEHLGQTWRYKYLWNQAFNEYSKDNWIPEYKINDAPFTDAQWKSVNSGITAELVAEISALRTELNELKQKALTARTPTNTKRK